MLNHHKSKNGVAGWPTRSHAEEPSQCHICPITTYGRRLVRLLQGAVALLGNPRMIQHVQPWQHVQLLACRSIAPQ